MDFLTQQLLAIVYAIARSALEKVGERIGERIGERVGDTIYEKFLGLLEQRAPNTAISIRKEPVQALDYGQLFQEVESEAQTNPEFAQTVQQLALTAKDHPLEDMNDILQNFAVVEKLKPQISELQSLISVWKKKMVNIAEIKQFLPDATDEQAQRYTMQIKRLGELESFFSDYSQELNGYEDLLTRARKAFNYKQPYRIAVIGTSGAGKSTMLNAMLGRELVLAKSGKAATGTALEIFLDVPENEEEKAVVTYHDQDNNFLEAIELKLSQYSGDHEEAQEDIKKLSKILEDLNNQYRNNDPSSLKTHFSLSDPSDERELKELIDENSDLNRDPNKRRIGLVKSVTYHIKPNKNSNGIQTLQLPNNVCLVDLPGLDGSPLHDIIISEGIKDADAVIFIMRAHRILGRGDNALLRRVGKYISPQGIEQSGERIFLVLNAIDTIQDDEPRSALDKQMGDVMELLPVYASPQLKKRGGDTPYFITSASIAYLAKKKIMGEPVDPKTYEGILARYGGKNKSDQEVLEASQVPKLVEELTKFARDKRIEGQIRDGKQALDSIINPLYSKYDSEYSGLKATQGETYFKELVETKLHDKQKQLKYQLVNFRKTVLKNLEAKHKDLDNKAKIICDEADEQLKKQMPQIWETHFNTDIAPLYEGGMLGQPFFEPVLDDAQMHLWYQLNQRLPELAKYFVEFYKDEFQKQQTYQNISNGCFGYPKVFEKLESTIKTLIQNMDSRMKKMSERIAMTNMTAPVNYFSVTLPQGNSKQHGLFEILEKIELQPVVPAENFNSFVKQVRQLYETQVSDECVFGLMNLYRYELIDIEKGLFSFIRDVFFEIRDSGDPYQIAQLLNIPDSELKRVQLLKDKLAALASIKD
ncbi:dynamin family protein [Nodularia sp. LEGE 04288]|uniref:dynamin family protein n=1 Tax=Nodularia sp. LEGE 04288 TaxID=1828639 RepID=UPI001D12A104|nr:dynamin family protein [Nodularia sp. LEGE 04288]MCC2691635.1 dynamin family protein [Nodularia sp. LEGE 04288]